MNEHALKLQQKFGYSDDLTNFLSDLIPALIEYYGQEYEQLIWQALSNCEIHVQEKTEVQKDYLNNYFGTDFSWEMPVLAGAFYHNQLTISDNKVYAKPIIYIPTVRYRQYYPFDFNDSQKVHTLIHEICHLIKGYGKVMVENGQVVDRTGLAKTYYKYNPEEGLVEDRDFQTGTEEAFNEYDTVNILQIMTKERHEIKGYVAAGNAARNIADNNPSIAKVIKKSQLEGTNEWIDYLGKENAKLLVDNLEVLVSALYITPTQAKDKDFREQLFEKTDIANKTLSDFSINYTDSKDKENFDFSLAQADQKSLEFVKQIVYANNQFIEESVNRKQ